MEAIKEDNWKHRSKEMLCNSCMWFVLKIQSNNMIAAVSTKEEAKELNKLYDIGRCRRHAPTMSGFPVVFNTDWCGDHKLNENALSAKEN